MRRDSRDRRFMFFQNPLTHVWPPPAWTGMPSADRTLAFGDAHVEKLLKKAEAVGPRPRSYRELLPVLLEMLAQVAPSEGWRGRPGRGGRIDGPEGRLCSRCAGRRAKKPCARCGEVAGIYARRPEGDICNPYRNKEPDAKLILRANTAPGRRRTPQTPT